MMNIRVFPNWLTSDEANYIREVTRAREHEHCDVNGLGYRWRTPLTEEEVNMLVGSSGSMLRQRLARGLGLTLGHASQLRPRYFDSVMRFGSHVYGEGGLEPHSDMLDEDRVLAVAYYANRVWDEQWGGEFVAHLNFRKDDEQQHQFQIPPIPNTLVAFVVSEDSWHSVNPVRELGPVRHALVGWLNGPPSFQRGYEHKPVDPKNTVITYETPKNVWTPGFQEGW